MRKALFASLSGVDPGVFDSQVLDYGLFMRSLGVDFRYLLFEGLRAWTGSRKRIEKTLGGYCARYGCEIELRYLLRPRSCFGMRRAAAHIARHGSRLSQSFHRVLIQARGVPAAWAALEAKRRIASAVVLYDARGDAVAEALMEARLEDRPGARRRWEKLADLLKALEARVCRESDHVFAVSGPLRDRICALGNRPAASVTVVPCCIRPDRFSGSAKSRDEARAHLDLKDRPVLVYSGSMSVWQLPKRLAALVGEVRKQVPNLCLLLLTPDRAEAEKHFGVLREQGTCKIISCGHEEVGHYLAAADAALLLREEDAVNQVACPVKFAEYQACGLPVILTPGIGDVSEQIQRTGYGRVVRLDEEVSSQAAEIAGFLHETKESTMRDRISREALARYSRESYREAYREVLDRLELGMPEGDRTEAEPAGREGLLP